MGTRSLTTFIDEPFTDAKGKTHRTKIVTMYRQMDGSPTSHGNDLAEFLAEFLAPGTMVNGIGMNDNLQFNGMGCLAAQVVAHFKKGVGGIYLEKPRAAVFENYSYEIESNGEHKPLTMRCFAIHKKREKLFEGSPKEYLTWIAPQIA